MPAASEPSESGELDMSLDILPGGTRFRVTIEGGFEQLGLLETAVFQPEVSEQLIAAVAAKRAVMKAEREQ